MVQEVIFSYVVYPKIADIEKLLCGSFIFCMGQIVQGWLHTRDKRMLEAYIRDLEKADNEKDT